MDTAAALTFIKRHQVTVQWVLASASSPRFSSATVQSAWAHFVSFLEAVSRRARRNIYSYTHSYIHTYTPTNTHTQRDPPAPGASTPQSQMPLDSDVQLFNPVPSGRISADPFAHFAGMGVFEEPLAIEFQK